MTSGIIRYTTYITLVIFVLCAGIGIYAAKNTGTYIEAEIVGARIKAYKLNRESEAKLIQLERSMSPEEFREAHRAIDEAVMYHHKLYEENHPINELSGPIVKDRSGNTQN